MGHIYSAEKRNDQLFYSTVVGAVVNLIFMLLLLSRIGLQAANISLALGFTATFVYRFLRIQKTVIIQLPKRELFISVIGITLNTIIFYALPSKPFVIGNMVVSAVVTCYVLRKELMALLALVLRKNIKLTKKE